MPATDSPVLDRAARLDLFESFRRLAFYVAGRFARRRPWLADDLESDALLAL
ncbi:MAG: hypothetical protein JWO38_814 [Gemmataceae bacterium]|nr:hypothetical protein [Gemmataceae bacterium]